MYVCMYVFVFHLYSVHKAGSVLQWFTECIAVETPDPRLELH